MDFFGNYIEDVSTSLKRMQVTENSGDIISTEQGVKKWCEATVELSASNNTMFFAGNGASASMASHMSADASKNGGFRSLAFNDISMLTAVSNDISYKECFALPLQRFANPGDILVTISSSGNSPNIIRAIDAAREIGLRVITVSGMKPNNRSRQMGDLNFYIPADTYGIVESSHQVLLHCWLDKFMGERK